MKKYLTLLLIGLMMSIASATPFGVSDVALEQLSQDTAWHRLLLFKQGKSDIHHASFFLSDGIHQEGYINPKDELVAILSAWERGDEAVCQFPARIHFLQQRLGIRQTLPSCPDFEAWYQSINADKLSVVFADEHPNNLASGFGHVLMRVDKFAGEPIAINYTPSYPSTESPALGAYRSLTGHYVGVMEVLPFAQKEQDYLNKDRRDLWQFELDLSQEATDQIVRHIWEVKDMARPYYLTYDNCATEIVRLLDLVRTDLSLTSQLGKITTPAKITQLIDQAGLIKKTEHLPSLSTKQQSKLNHTNSTHTKGNPTTATPMHRLGVSYIHQDNDNKVGLSYRNAYRDVLDGSVGVREFLELEILGVDITYDDKISLEHATLIRQRRYNPSNTAKGYDGKAGGFQLGLKRHYQDDDGKLMAHALVEQGRSWAIGQGQGGALPDALCYGFGVGAVALGNVDKGYQVGVGANVGCVHNISDALRAKAELSLPYWYGVGRGGGVGRFVPQVSVGVQYDISRHHALRMTWFKDKYHDTAKVAYHRYF